MKLRCGFEAPKALEDYLEFFSARLIARFWENVEKTDGCWIWNGRRDKFGYGDVAFCKVHSRAHRISYELCKGAIPAGQIVRHTCDIPECVNPSHLILGSALDNAQDRDSRGRGLNIGIKNRKLTPDDVRAIRSQYTGKYGQLSAMSRQYGVKHATLYKVIRKTGWKHVV